MVTGNLFDEGSAHGGGGLAGGSGEAPLDAPGSHGPELDTAGEELVFRKLVSFEKAKAASPRS